MRTYFYFVCIIFSINNDYSRNEMADNNKSEYLNI